MEIFIIPTRRATKIWVSIMNWLSSGEISALLLSLQVAFVGSIVSLPFAILLAIVMARKTFRGKFIVNNLILLPMVLPPVVIGYALLVLLARDGVVGAFFYNNFNLDIAFTWRAAAVAAAIMGFPLTVRAVRIAVEAIDFDAEISASVLGASPLYRLFYITLPLARGGIIAGFIMGFSRALGEFGATIVVAANIEGLTRTLPLALYHALQYPQGEIMALRLAIISVGLAAIAIAISELMLQFSLRQKTLPTND